MNAVAAPLSLIYRAALALAPTPVPLSAGCPVISIGNIHVGGVGKTPLVIALAKALLEMGLQPAVVSRGYGGRLSRPGGRVAPGMKAADAGDEPLEIASALPEVPVEIGADRVAAARRAAASARVLILDDGFQHRRLRRDLDIVVVPASSHPGAERLLPWGRLREPLSALHRADAIVRIADRDAVPVPAEVWRSATAAPVFEARRIVSGVRPYPGTVAPTALLGRPVILFSGIANPERFAATVESAGGRLVERLHFGDHHRFSERELELIGRLTRQHDAIAVTTAKDASRLDGRPLPFPAAIVETRIEAPAFLEFVLARIRELRP
jgi:tetraacyldisaccharide 4'-kinase